MRWRAQNRRVVGKHMRWVRIIYTYIHIYIYIYVHLNYLFYYINLCILSIFYIIAPLTPIGRCRDCWYFVPGAWYETWYLVGAAWRKDERDVNGTLSPAGRLVPWLFCHMRFGIRAEPAKKRLFCHSCSYFLESFRSRN